MRHVLLITFCMAYFLAVAEDAHSVEIEIENRTLVRWPFEHDGVAVIPSEVRHIGDMAFSNCRLLTEVVFPNGLETIGQLAFSECVRLQDVCIPKSVTNIGSSAFFNCRSLTSIVVRACITDIPKGMCNGCCRLGRVELPDRLVDIGDRAFFGCRSIGSIVFPESLVRIGQAAFCGCSRLKGVVLPRKFQKVGMNAFESCYDLAYIVMPFEITAIEEGAFRNCFRLAGIVDGRNSMDVGNDCLIDRNGKYVMVSCGQANDLSVEDIRKKLNGAGVLPSYDSIDVAIAACGKRSKIEVCDKMYDGLERALRIAADGLLLENPDQIALVCKIDALGANLFKLAEMDNAHDIKDFLGQYASMSMDTDQNIIAYLSVPDDVAIMAEFNAGKLGKLDLSAGLKKLVREGSENGAGIPDVGVLRWLR